jgi:hypothetical protein
MKKQKTVDEKVKHFLTYSDFVSCIKHTSYVSSWTRDKLTRFVKRVIKEEKNNVNSRPNK